jgi:hypothetical protein
MLLYAIVIFISFSFFSQRSQEWELETTHENSTQLESKSQEGLVPQRHGLTQAAPK